MLISTSLLLFLHLSYFMLQVTEGKVVALKSCRQGICIVTVSLSLSLTVCLSNVPFPHCLQLQRSESGPTFPITTMRCDAMLSQVNGELQIQQ